MGLGEPVKQVKKRSLNKLLKVTDILSPAEYQKLKDDDKPNYTWDPDQQLYNKNQVKQIDESKTAKLMALLTALGATYGLEDEARAFADQLQRNIEDAQTAPASPGRPDPVTQGNPEPGPDRVMRPPVRPQVDEIAPAALATVGRVGAGAASAAVRGVSSMAKTAGTKIDRKSVV